MCIDKKTTLSKGHANYFTVQYLYTESEMKFSKIDFSLRK